METPEAVEQFLCDFENARENEGWDRAPSFWVVTSDRRAEHFMDVPSGHDPIDVLKGFKRDKTTLADSGFRGLIVSMEGWIHPDRILHSLGNLDPDVAMAAFKNLRDPSQYPDRQEVRTVVMVDFMSNVYIVGRKRGEGQARFHVNDKSDRDDLSDGMKYLLGVHPRQNVQRVIQSAMDDLSDLIKTALQRGPLGEPTDEENAAIDELVDRILTAYKVHMPEEYDRQVRLLKKMTGRKPRQ